MTIDLLHNESPYYRWQTYLSEQNEQTYRNNTVWWNTAQTATIVALCVLGVATLLSPYVFPVTYSNLLMNAFAFVPLILPIPGYFYNYCSLQAAQANKICEKIIFFRKEHPKIENNTSALEHAIEQTFEGNLSSEKKLILEKTTKIHPPILSHINFFTQELEILEKKRQELHSDLSNYKENDFDLLLNNPLFIEWQEIIIQAKKNWIENRQDANSLMFLQDLIKILNQDSSDNHQATTILKNLYWRWRNKDSLTLTEKWTPLFLLEEKILDTKIHQLFLWTFLFLPEKALETCLKKHHLQIEDSLYSAKIKKIALSISDSSTGLTYKDPAVDNILSLSNETLTKKQILDPKLKEETLDKILHHLNS